jgi:hypothetical protein
VVSALVKSSAFCSEPNCRLPALAWRSLAALEVRPALPVVHAEISRFLHGLTRIPTRNNFTGLQGIMNEGFSA